MTRQLLIAVLLLSVASCSKSDEGYRAHGISFDCPAPLMPFELTTNRTDVEGIPEAVQIFLYRKGTLAFMVMVMEGDSANWASDAAPYFSGSRPTSLNEVQAQEEGEVEEWIGEELRSGKRAVLRREQDGALLDWRFFELEGPSGIGYFVAGVSPDQDAEALATVQRVLKSVSLYDPSAE